MSEIPARLQQILDGLEGEHNEFKEWKTKDDFDGLTKYACALANEGGGKIVLGVADQRPRKIVGTHIWPQFEVTRKSLNQRIHLTTQWEEIQTPQGRVLVITVPRHAYGLPAAWDGRAWMRENDSLIPLSEARRKAIWEEIGRDFVYSRKPNPAMLADSTFEPDLVRAHLTTTRDICAKHGCPLEFILKDISTIRYEPERLASWAEVAMDVAGG